MTGFTVVKGAVHVLSALGVAKVLGEILRNNTTIVTATDKVLVNTGGIVLGSMVTQAASKHVTEQIKSAATWFENQKEEIEEVKEEVKEAAKSEK